MAASVKQPKSTRAVSGQRRGHDRKAISSARRRECYFPLLPVEWQRDCSSRRLRPLRTLQRHFQQQSLPSMETVNNSTSSTGWLVEHVGSIQMERTSSGTSIIPDKSFEPRHNNMLTYCDKEAADKVQMHFKRRSPGGKHERILRNLIESPFPVDENGLDSILTATDSVFFGGVLSGRVRWEWSGPSQPRFETELIGTTALRPAAQGGYETLVVLSGPILKHPGYDPRLLLSAFLHELVHCYLFIQCGFPARLQGGHTDGFHAIVNIIDRWVGSGYLHLCDMKANLDHFLNHRGRLMDVKAAALGDHRHDGCNQSPRLRREYYESPGLDSTWT